MLEVCDARFATQGLAHSPGRFMHLVAANVGNASAAVVAQPCTKRRLCLDEHGARRLDHSPWTTHVVVGRRSGRRVERWRKPRPELQLWSHTKQTALGPVLGVAVGRSINGAIKTGFRDDNDAAATRVEEQLHASVTRLGGHAGLTFAMLSGRLQWRGLVGIQHLSIRITGLDQPSTESYDTFTFALGGRLRFPARGQWLGFVGAGCGAAPNFLGVVDKSCSGEVGVEWELLR